MSSCPRKLRIKRTDTEISDQKKLSIGISRNKDLRFLLDEEEGERRKINLSKIGSSQRINSRYNNAFGCKSTANVTDSLNFSSRNLQHLSFSSTMSLILDSRYGTG